MSNHCKACAGRICTTPTAALYLPGPKPPLTYEDCPGCPECAKKDDEIAWMQEKVAQQVEELNTIIRQKWDLEAELGGIKKRYLATIKGRDHDNLMLRDAVAVLTAERDALRADLTALAEAIDTCLGGRGAYSCAPTHDCRCDKDRGISDECVCGADDLTAALNRPGVQAILNR